MSSALRSTAIESEYTTRIPFDDHVTYEISGCSIGILPLRITVRRKSRRVGATGHIPSRASTTAHRRSYCWSKRPRATLMVRGAETETLPGDGIAQTLPLDRKCSCSLHQLPITECDHCRCAVRVTLNENVPLRHAAPMICGDMCDRTHTWAAPER